MRVSGDIISPAQISRYEETQLRHLLIPLVTSRVSAGFPSPADDYLDETGIDLNELCIENPSSTFLVRVRGESMMGAGIFPGDLVVIDKSLEARDKQIVLAVINNEFTLKRLRIIGRQYFLYPENPAFQPIEIKAGMDFEVWGVVVCVIRVLNSAKAGNPLAPTAKAIRINR